MLYPVLALSSAFYISVSAAASCYFPDGSPSEYVPCPSNNAVTVCCASPDYCTPAGFCLSVFNGYHYRGACTDKSWSSPSCANTQKAAQCLDNIGRSNSSYVNIVACDARQNSGSWCCAYGESNCCSGTTFVPDWGNGLVAASPDTPSSPTTSGTSSSNTDPAKTTGSPPSSPTAPTAPSSPGANTTSIVLGALFGVALLAMFTVSAVFFFRRRRRGKTAPSQQQHAGTTGYHVESFKGPPEELDTIPFRRELQG